MLAERQPTVWYGMALAIELVVGLHVPILSVSIGVRSPSKSRGFVYFPGMSKDELLLIKTYDSAQRPFRPTLHTAFEPGEGQGGAPRRSCEARLLLVFPPAKL